MYSVITQASTRSMSAAVMFALLAGPFMALMPQTAQAVSLPTCTVVSDSAVQESGSNSFELVAPYQHPAWTASIPGAKWIWGDAMVVTPDADVSQTFTATFNLTNAPSGAVLDVASDNGYSVTLGSLATSVTDENNFQPGTQDTYAGITGLVAGTNTLTITVNNKGVSGATAENNPAGLLFKLEVTGANCGAPTTAPVISYPINGSTIPAVAMVDWNDITDPESPVTYQYQSSLSPATNPDGSFVTPAFTSGSLATPEIPTPGTPYGTYYVHAKAIDNNGNQSVWGPTSSFTVANVPPTPTNETIVISGNTTGTENTPGEWMFGRDLTTVTPFSFSVGNAAIGVGSLSVAPITNTNFGGVFGNSPNRDKFIGEHYMQTPIADIDSISFDFKIAAPADTVEEQFYLNVYATFGSSLPTKFYDCRYDVVATVGSTTAFSTVTFDPSVASYTVTTRGGASASPFPCPASPAGMDALSSGSKIRAVAINVGDTSVSDTGVAGYLDRVVKHISSATTDHTTTYDFEPFIEVVETSDVTICKVADTYPEPTPLPGWNVFLQGMAVTDGPITVPTNTAAGTTTGAILSSGTSYLAKAFGTWTNQGGANAVDAEYSSTDNFVADVMDGYDGYGTDILELQINQTFDPNSNWGPYNSLHEYAQSFVAATSTANFRVFDGTGITQNPDWFGDNNGSLRVDLYEGFSGITGKDGCVTLENVPLGEYTIGETPQDGWEDVTDEYEQGHNVVVTENAEENVFYLYNFNEEFGSDSCEIVSDMTTLEGGTWTYENEGPLHPSWTAVVDAFSYWIWGDEGVDDPTSQETQTFTKTFWLESLPEVDATLTIAADNSYMVELNGTWTASDGNQDNYTDAGKDELTILAGEFELGANTLVLTVTNLAQGGGTQASNPAGLNYKLSIPGTECSEEPFDQAQVQVHISKYILNEDDEIEPATEEDSAFPMVSTWSAANIGAGSGAYSLNASNGFEASTSYMTRNADYLTSEVTDGSVVVPMSSKSCPAGKYRLVGYKTGDTLIEAENDAIDDDAPAFTSLDSDKYVIVVNEDCDELDTPPTEQVKVHVYKYLSTGEGSGQVANGAGIDPFPMVSTWKADNLNGAATTSGPYVLGDYHGGAVFKYAADTSLMDVGANYTTSEVTGENGIVPIGGTCTAGAYRLVGYKTGATPEAAALSPLLTTAPFLANLQTDQSILVINEDCDEVDDSTPTVNTQLIVVTPADMKGWIFLPENVNGGQTGQMITGPLTPPLGTGSAEFILTANDQGQILANVQFAGTRLDKITTLKYSTYKASAGVSLPALQFEFDDDVTDANNLFKGRMVFEPYHNNRTITAGTWQEWDTQTNGDGNATGNWWFSTNANFPAGQVSCPQSNPCTYAEIVALYPNAGIRNPITPTTGGMLFKVGSGGGVYTSSVDQLKVGVVAGLVTTNKTFDFDPNPTPAVLGAESFSNGGGGGGGGSSNSQGSVLGASTDSCDALLMTYLSEGTTNSADEVTKLQGFLNENLGITLPVTGIFGSQTNAAVRQFQTKYWEDILKPWFAVPGSGITSKDTPSGYVYKTTKWKINDLYCPGSEALPQIP